MKFRFSSVPYIVWSVIFVVVPLILVAVFGLSTSDGQSTFANVAKVSDYTAVFVRSIWLSLVAHCHLPCHRLSSRLYHEPLQCQ